MQVTNKYKRIPTGDIVVNREERQRQRISTENIVDSIRKYGVLQPIIIDKNLVLIAGERRLAASIEVGHPDIPCRFIDDLTEVEAQIIELEENLKRQDLTWQDDCRAVRKIHELYSKSEPDWNQVQTAKAVGIAAPTVSEILRVAKELDTNARVAAAPTRSAALNMLMRSDERKIGDVLSDIIDAGSSILTKSHTSVGGDAVPATPKLTVVQDDILHGDFLKWAPAYSGPTFNLIHCDFPFGANLFGGKMSGRETVTAYTDTPEVYQNLIKCLCQNLDRLMSHSGHLMFWFSMEFYSETLQMFAQLAPSLEFSPFPLIWHKTDNMGLLPDPKRWPRRVYETCLLASREDRYIIRAVSNAYGAPTDKLYHPSTKPEPVLRHFFQMLVDDNTRMLDPTCGSGSSLRAAESLGAASVLGLELDPDHVSNAKAALRKFRSLRSAAK